MRLDAAAGVQRASGRAAPSRDLSSLTQCRFTAAMDDEREHGSIVLLVDETAEKGG
jgi:hypothetical protein